jgi:glutathione-specific gamma-glutamylcyclotransferase
MLRYVRQGHGRSGANRDYLLSTVEALEALGCRDRDLHLLAEQLRGVHEMQPYPLQASGG